VLFGQNLVKNGSFEDYTECPNALGTFKTNVRHWTIPTNGTTDYFNTCSKVMGAPENFNGIQHPKFGNAYAGIYFYAPTDYREYIQVALKKMLNKGQLYTLNFYISLAEGSDFAVKDFGVLFSYKKLQISTKKNITRGQLFRVKGNKHNIIEINHPEFHEDKSEWLKIAVEFEAKGFEKYLILGNLRTNASTRKVQTKRVESKRGAYYYIDEVTLSTDKPVAESQDFELNTIHTFKNIHFEHDIFELNAEAKAYLEQVYDYLIENPGIVMTVHGHTDSVGALAYNQKLSEKRAKSIVDYFIKLGLNEDRMDFVGHANKVPIAKNSTELGRRKNRRATFELTEK